MLRGAALRRGPRNRSARARLLSHRAARRRAAQTSTWGVFERPSNISEAFGGGRNLTPGGEAGDAEAAAASLAKVRSAVSDYRKKLGIDVEPEVAVEVTALLATGDAAMSAGQLDAAADAFRQAADKAALASAQGGTARLRLALCLDSQGRAEEARELYTALGRHPDGNVKKQAARLLWGMTEATEFMKADTISFDAGMKETYSVYLSSQANAWDVYISERDAEDTAALQRASIAAAVALLALPVGLLAALRAAAEAHRVTIVG